MRDMRTLRMAIAVSAVASLIACGNDDDDAAGDYNPYEGYASALYEADDMWLCRPGLERNYCFDDQDATEFLPDGSTRLEAHQAADETEFDCFYIYPTVDLLGPVGNHTDFSDISLELDPLMNQAAPLNGLCTVYAPLYRQITIGTYADDDAERYLEIAYEDVEEAFRHYMGQHNRGRPIIIVGHSQGSHMTRRLLQREFDEVPEMLDKFVVGLLIGGDVEVPFGEKIGGSFDNIPLCSSKEQLGCVIAYRSYSQQFPPEGDSGSVPTEGEMDSACTNPAALGGGKGLLGASYFPVTGNQEMYGNLIEGQLEANGVEVDTPRILYRDYFTAECVTPPGKRSYLEITVTPRDNDQRPNPVPFDNPFLSTLMGLGLHILDFNFAMGDLTDLVETKTQRYLNR